MSYRKIEVDGKTYEYVVGKDVTKVKGLGVFQNADYGVPIHARDARVDESGVELPVVKYLISAYGVRLMIRGLKRSPYRKTCTKHNFVCTGQTSSPYDSEIYEKITWMDNCPHCVHDDAMEI